MNKDKAHEIIQFILEEGRKLPEISGKVEDIGIKKQYLTEYDLKIERGLKEIINKMPGKNHFFSEEENDNFVDAESVWIADPISGTKRFINGEPNYAVVVSHMSKGKVDFACVYVPTANALYLASREDGITINGKRLGERKSFGRRLIYAPTYKSEVIPGAKGLGEKLEQKYEIFPSQGSFAYNYCLVAEGKFDGIVSLTNDSFPEFAGCFIANQSGVIATNISG
ncbi:MAG: inositol monophosphatase family protein [Firmicutes bacterium]|nr:inositol monophosphatase family protein [Bacillota bacterium]